MKTGQCPAMLLRAFAVTLMILTSALFAEVVLGVHIGLVRFVQHDAALLAEALSPW